MDAKNKPRDSEEPKPEMVLKAEPRVQCGCGGNCMCGDDLDKA